MPCYLSTCATEPEASSVNTSRAYNKYFPRYEVLGLSFPPEESRALRAVPVLLWEGLVPPRTTLGWAAGAQQHEHSGRVPASGRLTNQSKAKDNSIKTTRPIQLKMAEH